MNRVAIITPSLRGGGAEKVALNLSNYYSSIGYKVDLILLRKTGPYVKFVNNSVNLIDFQCVRVRDSFFKIRKYLKNNPNVKVLSVVRNTNILVGLASYGIEVNSINFREASTLDPINNLPRLESSFYKLLMRLSYRKSNLIIANSKDTKSDLLKHKIADEAKIKILDNPVLPFDLDYKLSQDVVDDWLNDSNIKVILGVGRLEKVKDFTFLVDVFSCVYSVNKLARLIIVGSGQEKNNILSIASEKGVSHVVRIISFQDNIFPYFAKADIFALTSKWEGFGNVVVEALAAKISIVSLDCPGGVRMILKNGMYGDLIPMGDNQGFVDALLKYLDYPFENKQILYDRALEFSVSTIAKKYIKSINSASSKE